MKPYEEHLRRIARGSGFPYRSEALSDVLYGNNIIGRQAPLPLNTENHGFTFFTRPDLNLAYNNIQMDRVLSNLLMGEKEGLQKIVRAYLDPRAHRGDNSFSGASVLPIGKIRPEPEIAQTDSQTNIPRMQYSQDVPNKKPRRTSQREGKTVREEDRSCSVVDPYNPFIPLLGNNLISISGWEEMTLGTHTSEPGVYREVYGYVDDVPYQYGSYNLQCTFRNLIGDPITFLFRMWTQYEGLVYEGRILPYIENILYNVIDYNTRIYRVVTDATRTYVTRLFACGAAFPISNSIAMHADFDASPGSSPFQAVGDNLTFQFMAFGFTNYDHILIYEFNKLHELFNDSMLPENRNERMVKLSQSEKTRLNYRAYPHINADTMELEWWVPKEAYRAMTASLKESATNE